jgi:hypothetical protein
MVPVLFPDCFRPARGPKVAEDSATGEVVWLSRNFDRWAAQYEFAERSAEPSVVL